MTLLLQTARVFDTIYNYVSVLSNALSNIIRIVATPVNQKRWKFILCKIILYVVAIFSIVNMLLVLAGVEVNPGPKSKINKYSFAVWNLDSTMATNKCKISLIESLNSVYKYSLFGLCETYLTKDIYDSEISKAVFCLHRTDLRAMIHKEKEKEEFVFIIMKIFP